MKLLIVDDEKRLRDMFKILCEGAGFEVDTAESPTSALQMFERHVYDIVFVDVRMPEMDGITLMKRLKEIDPAIEVIIITAHGSIETAVEAMREGAADFIPKPFGSDELQAAIERTTRFRQLNHQLRETENELLRIRREKESGLDEVFVGQSNSVVTALDLVDKLAVNENVSVLITGDSGTGKELIARRLHRLSPRASKPFFAVNCAAIVDTLFESEFFGHRKGAFTGADMDQSGWFERANGSTLFLDEITEIPIRLQAKLLRVLEERSVTRVGETGNRSIDVRIIASSNQPIEDIVEEGKFRKDLFFRLNGFRLHLSPLRERPDDIPLLCKHFLNGLRSNMTKHVTSVSANALHELQTYPFPGNVRELKNLVERAVILSGSETIESFYLPESAAGESSLNLRELEVTAIRQALERAGGNKSLAAKLLGISWQSLHRKLKSL